MNVVDTLIVNFGEAVATASGSIIAEWDDSLNLDAGGEVKTQFVPGDEIFLLVHHDADVSIVDVKPTAGSLSNLGNIQLQRIQEIGWGNIDDEQQLTYNPTGNLAFAWKGRVGLAPVKNGKAVTLGSSFPCLALVSYGVDFTRYRLQTPIMTLAKDETFPLRVYIYYQETGA